MTRIGMKEGDMEDVAQFMFEVITKKSKPSEVKARVSDWRRAFRTVQYCYGEAQRLAAETPRDLFQHELGRAGLGRITTEILSAPEFYYAEDYHQQYLAKNPGGYCGLGGTGVSCPVGVASR